MKDCGVLLHISSLPSSYGIGDMGDAAYRFAEFLSNAGQSYWQILPLGPTSYGNSPYQATSSFAGNPYFIDLEALRFEKLLTDDELDTARRPLSYVDYGDIFDNRIPLLKRAYARFDTSEPDYVRFCDENESWLYTYALFSAVKDEFGLRPHWEWDKEFRDPHSDAVKAFAASHGKELGFYRFLQYKFDSQWRKLKTYVNSLGIKIIGDAPIYAAYDSADFWEDPARFTVDEYGAPAEIAGVPPDYFSEDGQRWGNPLYDWERLKARGYDFWVERVRRLASLVDRLRIDHFRGFCAYYAIAAECLTAREGTWRAGPDKALFDELENRLGKIDIIAEDLGVDSPELRKLLLDCGFPGMKVLQFGFDGDAEYNAHAVCNFTRNCIAYTGTHDNDTACGWYNGLSAVERKKVRSRLPRRCGDISKAMICSLYGSRAETAIVPMQDWLREGSEARMNTPGTGDGNWRYRLKEIPGAELCGEMRAAAEKYRRIKRDR